MNRVDIIATDNLPRPAWQMYRAMVGVGVVCALLIVTVYLLTFDVIARKQVAALEQAVLEVVPGAVTFARVDDMAQPVYVAFNSQDELAGIALEAQGMGYQDTVRILYGYDPTRERVVGMRVLQSRETPGLGDRVETDPDFRANFAALDVRLADDGARLLHPVQLVKPGEKTAEWQIDAISGATITSSAIVTMLADSAAIWVPQLHARRAQFIHAGGAVHGD